MQIALQNIYRNARRRQIAGGVYATSPIERTFCDIRVTHPNYASNEFKDLKNIYSEQEKAKNHAYEERVVQAEKGSLIVPLIFTTSGGMGLYRAMSLSNDQWWKNWRPTRTRE